MDATRVQHAPNNPSDWTDAYADVGAKLDELAKRMVVLEPTAALGVDTAEKRRSVAGVMLPFAIAGVTANSSQDAEWRQQSGWSYSGIAI